MGLLAVRLLGPVEVDVNGSKVALTRTLERALLARLALDPGQPVSNGRLVDDLWGDHVPSDPAASLQGLVYRLRRTLGAEGRCIVHVGNGYELDGAGAQSTSPSSPSSWRRGAPGNAPSRSPGSGPCWAAPSTCGGDPPWAGWRSCRSPAPRSPA